MRIYIAAPFFTSEELETVARLETLLEDRGHVPRSPRLFAGTFNHTPEDAARIFIANERELRACDLIVARIDDWDTGTTWEMGYGYALNIPVVAFTTMPARGLNLMLSQSCDGLVHGFVELERVFRGGMYDKSRLKELTTSN